MRENEGQSPLQSVSFKQPEGDEMPGQLILHQQPLPSGPGVGPQPT